MVMPLVNTGLHKIGQTIILIDKVMDFIPIMSVFNNVIILISKVALGVLFYVIPPLYRLIQDTSVIKYFTNKHAFVCVVLSIPVFNFFFAIMWHLKPPADAHLKTPICNVDPIVEKLHQMQAAFLAQYEATQGQTKIKSEENKKNRLEAKAQSIHELKKELTNVQQKLNDGSISASRRALLQSVLDRIKESIEKQQNNGDDVRIILARIAQANGQ